MTKPIPSRTCIVTGEELPQSALLRFVASPERQVVFDLKGNLPGRGMYVVPQQAKLAEAVKRNLFSKSAKEKLKAEAELPTRVEQLLRERALSYLSRAWLAGEMVTGHEKVLSMLRAGDAAVLVHASDGGEDGMRKLNSSAGDARVVIFCDREMIGNAIQKTNPVHLAIKKGGISSAFLDSYDRWAGFIKSDAVEI